MDDLSLLVWANPSCSKSRRALELLEEHGVHAEVRNYLENPPSRAELSDLLEKLGTHDARAIVRTKEAAYTARNLEHAAHEAVLAAITEVPILLERPIVVRGARAVIARPPEKLLELL